METIWNDWIQRHKAFAQQQKLPLQQRQLVVEEVMETLCGWTNNPHRDTSNIMATLKGGVVTTALLFGLGYLALEWIPMGADKVVLTTAVWICILILSVIPLIVVKLKSAKTFAEAHLRPSIERALGQSRLSQAEWDSALRHVELHHSHLTELHRILTESKSISRT
jgi:hypothetical protein